jgi:arylsulfatase A-like enzyme
LQPDYRTTLIPTMPFVTYTAKYNRRHRWMMGLACMVWLFTGCSGKSEPKTTSPTSSRSIESASTDQPVVSSSNNLEHGQDHSPAPTFRRPNIILLTLDDADCELFEHSETAKHFPNFQRLAQRGVSFSNLHVTTPLYGPSRVSLYRGQYAHNTGIRSNEPLELVSNGFQGGFQAYRLQGFFEDDLSTWMKSSGYRTMLVGKYLHAVWEPTIPPGWDDFPSFQGAKYYGTFVFSNRHSPTDNGEHLPADRYRIHAEFSCAIELLTSHFDKRSSQPFFLNLNSFAPHQPSGDQPMIDASMKNSEEDVSVPESLVFDEPDVSDKSGYYNQLRELSEVEIGQADRQFRERIEATESADQMLGNLLDWLDERGLLDETYLFVTSDNGFSSGHHRNMGKATPMDRSTHVPLFVAGPAIPAGHVCDQLLGHIDIAPTIVDLAGQTPPPIIDGRSFTKLLFNPRLGGVVRNELLIENWQSRREHGKLVNAASSALRLNHEIYIEWANGGRDYYDLNSDPEQLENHYGTLSPSRKSKLAQRLRTLKNSQIAPIVTITQPFSDDVAASQIDALQGMADDGRGVNSVALTLFNETSKSFWNGAEWQMESVSLKTELTNSRGLITIWSYRNLPQWDKVQPAKIVVTAEATNVKNIAGQPVIRKFRLSGEQKE